jgi:hypothetical protein
MSKKECYPKERGKKKCECWEGRINGRGEKTFVG